MEYYRTYWQHDDDYPVWIYSEIDNHRYDTRRIEIFRNRSAKYFDNRTPLEVGVALYPTSFDAINSEGELKVDKITSKEFNEILSLYNLDELIENYYEGL